MSTASTPSAVPVALFAYARPEHTENTIRSLAENSCAVERELIVFSDGPRSEGVADRVRQVRAFLDTVPDRGWFKSVQITAAEDNLGLARSVIRGVTQVLESHDAVVVVEDDLQLASDFLTFMDAALTFYQADDTIWSVSGFTPQLPSLASYGHDVYLAPRASSWGWGIWRRSWELVDWTVADYRFFEWSLQRRMAFNRGGRDLSAMLDAQMDGRIDSWAVRWCYSQHLHGMHTVFPAVSKVRNAGLDGSGTHGAIGGDLGPALVPVPAALENVAPDASILRDFARSFRRYNKCPPWSFLRHLAAKRTNPGLKGRR